MKNRKRKILIGAISAIAVACCVCLCVIGLNKPTGTDSPAKFFTTESDSAAVENSNNQQGVASQQSSAAAPSNTQEGGHVVDVAEANSKSSNQASNTPQQDIDNPSGHYADVDLQIAQGYEDRIVNGSSFGSNQAPAHLIKYKYVYDNGVKVLHIGNDGDYDHEYNSSSLDDFKNNGWYKERATIGKVVIDEKVTFGTCQGLFGCVLKDDDKGGKVRLMDITDFVGLENIDLGIQKDGKQVFDGNADYMFAGCDWATSSGNKYPSGLDKVTSAYAMFSFTAMTKTEEGKGLSNVFMNNVANHLTGATDLTFAFANNKLFTNFSGNNLSTSANIEYMLYNDVNIQEVLIKSWTTFPEKHNNWVLNTGTETAKSKKVHIAYNPSIRDAVYNSIPEAQRGDWDITPPVTEFTITPDNTFTSTTAVNVPQGCKWNIIPGEKDEDDNFTPTEVQVLNGTDVVASFTGIDIDENQFDKVNYGGSTIKSGDEITSSNTLSAAFWVPFTVRGINDDDMTVLYEEKSYQDYHYGDSATIQARNLSGYIVQAPSSKDVNFNNIAGAEVEFKYLPKTEHAIQFKSQTFDIDYDNTRFTKGFQYAQCYTYFGNIAYSGTDLPEGWSIISNETSFEVPDGQESKTYTFKVNATVPETEQYRETTKTVDFKVTLYTKHDKVEPTCKKSGLQAYCTSNDKYYDETHVLIGSGTAADFAQWCSPGGKGYIAPDPHSFIEQEGQEPTYTQPGFKHYKECSICGALYEWDETTPIPNLTTWKEKGGRGYIAPNAMTINFDAQGGSPVQGSVTQVYGEIMITESVQVPTLAGYTFDGYYSTAKGGTKYFSADGRVVKDVDDTPIVCKLIPDDQGKATLYAHWTARTDTPYTVEHWTQDLDGGYSLAESETFTGTTDTEVTPATKVYEGFTAPETKTVKIAGDGSTVVSYFYSRNSHTLTINYTGCPEPQTHTETLAYGETYTVLTPQIEGYTPDKPYVSGTMGDADITETVTYSVNSHTLTIHYKYTDGKKAADDHVESVNYGVRYNVESPKIVGYTPDQDSVSGDMPDVDVEETVTYTANTYEVTFDANGGTPASQKVNETYDAKYQMPATVPTMEGHTFDGWYTQQEGGTKVTTDTTVKITASQTLYAHWTVNTHTLTVNYTGCPEPQTHTETLAYGETYTVLTPQIEGYTPDKPYVSGTMGDADITETVTYSVNSHTLTIHYKYTDGKKAADDHVESVNYGVRYNVESPKIVGYTPDQDSVSGDMPDVDVEETVTYTANTYEVTFDANGGTPASQKVNETYDAKYQMPATVPTMEGHTFDGWYTQQEGGIKVTTDTTVKITASQTLYAHWTVNTHTLTVNYTGCPEPQTHIETLAYGETYTVLTPQIEGYTPDKPYVSGTMGDADITETVTYSVNSHTLTIHYKYTDGKKAADDHVESVNYGVRYNVESPKIVGYTPDQDSVSGDMPDVDVEETVTYTANTYEVTFDANGGTPASQKVNETYDAKYQMPATVPTMEGHTFDGWYTQQEGGTKVTTDTTVKITASQTLYAHWSTETFTVRGTVASGQTTWGSVTGGTIEVPSGTVYTVKSNKVIVGDVSNPLGIITATGTNEGISGGYGFLSWSPNTSGTIDSNKTFTASFASNEITLGMKTSGGGTISPSVQGSIKVPKNAIVDVDDNTHVLTIGGYATTPIANPGYSFKQWAYQGGQGSTIPSVITAGGEFTAMFDSVATKYTITGSVAEGQSEMGSVTPSTISNVPAGSAININHNVITFGSDSFKLTANANSGYEFDGWTGGPQSGTVQDNYEYVAHFKSSGPEPTKYTVTANLDGGTYSTTPEGWTFDEGTNTYTKEYDEGSNVQDIKDELTNAKPEKTGFELEGWDVNPSGDTIVANTTFTAKWKSEAGHYKLELAGLNPDDYSGTDGKDVAGIINIHTVNIKSDDNGWLSKNLGPTCHIDVKPIGSYTKIKKLKIGYRFDSGLQPAIINLTTYGGGGSQAYGNKSITSYGAGVWELGGTFTCPSFTIWEAGNTLATISYIEFDYE